MSSGSPEKIELDLEIQAEKPAEKPKTEAVQEEFPAFDIDLEEGGGLELGGVDSGKSESAGLLDPEEQARAERLKSLSGGMEGATLSGGSGKGEVRTEYDANRAL